MPIFKSLSDSPDLMELFRRFSDGVRPLCELHDIFLRGDSPLSVAERELIAAYVSGLNACNYCFGAHSMIAEAHGVEPALFEMLVDDPASAPVDRKLLPLLAFVRKLTLTPSRIGPADAEPVRAAGWSELALYHAIVVCALFNFMNRIVNGTGIKPSAESDANRRARLESTSESSSYYRDFARVVLRDNIKTDSKS